MQGLAISIGFALMTTVFRTQWVSACYALIPLSSSRMSIALNKLYIRLVSLVQVKS
uniref:Secreted protein n=1 Tax=Ascaris lumbricoides TaxID=6252 RepID=A0A0M3I1V5_ASCLU